MVILASFFLFRDLYILCWTIQHSFLSFPQWFDL
jgi:hypothetical protein